MNTSGSVIVSWDFSNGRDSGILLVGGKNKRKDVEVINAFQGKEAENLYLRLVTPKGDRK